MMAEYRYVRCAFWTDPFILGLTPEEKYFYLYLMTNSHTRQCGVYELPRRLMELETGYNAETLAKLISRFVGYEKISYSHESEVFIHNWLKFNCPNSAPVIKCIIRELSTIKTIEFKAKTIESLHSMGYALDIPSIPPTYTIIKELKEKKEKEIKKTCAQEPVDNSEQPEVKNFLKNDSNPQTPKRQHTPERAKAIAESLSRNDQERARALSNHEIDP